ncbi:MAG: DUF5906 domain-containing protein [Bacteroidales bacterium]|jgi:putative DNA primase/helicase|nr:DUF5906 domain-containing protein [Bacteroidales bacterium]
MDTGLDIIKGITAEFEEYLTPEVVQTKSKGEILKLLVNCFAPLDFKVLKYSDTPAVQLGDNLKLTKPDLKVLIVNEILKAARVNNWNLCRQGGYCYIYNGTFWEKLNDDDLKHFLSDCAVGMGIESTTATEVNFVDTLYKQFAFSAHLQPPEFSRNEVLINLQNGTFEINTQRQELRGFNPADFLTHQLPFLYDPKAQAPIFTQYLNRVLPDETAQAVLAEYIGYLFIRHGSGLKLEKCLILYGKGANGKSVFYEVLTALLGKESTCSYTLSELTDTSGYYRAEISNKLVNYASEISRQMNSDMFKKLASGEPFTARSPYEKPFEVYNYAKMIFNANELPKDTEQTNAFFRRFLIIPFDVTIPENEQDKELHRKIISTELAGVFNWVLAGLKRLLVNKKFTECKASADCLEQYRIDSDTVASFLHENDYQPSTSERIPLKELYAKYRDYCSNDGYRACSNRTFADRLRVKKYGIMRGREGMSIYIEKTGKTVNDCHPLYPEKSLF